MSSDLTKAVRERAGARCEYCLLPDHAYPLPFQVDHVVARQHAGRTLLDNLAWACGHCNAHKGPNIAGIDPATLRVTRLFDPRRDRWARHFRWKGAILFGRTAVGRTTVQVLAMNEPLHLEGRRELMAEGLFDISPSSSPPTIEDE